MVDHSAMKLGRIAPTPEQRKKALPLSRYTKAPLPKAPPVFHGADGAPIAMFGNDKVGNCAIVALANYRAIRSVREGFPFPTTESDVVKAYFDFTDNKDIGCVETEVLAKAANSGFYFGGSEPWIAPVWASVSLRDLEMCRSLIAILGALYIGCELPISAQRQKIWTKPVRQSGDDAPGSWGGHALLWSGYNDNNSINDLPTWGEAKHAEQGWLNAYCDEAYALIDADAALSPLVDFDALMADWLLVQAQ